MNTLHEAFERQAGNAGTPDFDIEELIDLGEHRLRRHRLTAVLGAAAAVIIAVAIGVTALNGRGTPRPAPIDHLRPPEETPPTRQLVYGDVTFVLGAGQSGITWGPLHVGARSVDPGGRYSHLDVTDDGVVYTTGGDTDGRVWFTDGGKPEQIGSHACVEAHGFPDTVVTGNSGSLAAWFDCTRKHHAELVVFDTGSDREVVRRQVPRCDGYSNPQAAWSSYCYPKAIIGDRVYINRGDALISSDGEAAALSFARDIRSNPRGLVIGDSWETATPTLDGFAVVGRRLVPSGDGSPISVFDTATRRPIRLHLPPGYRADHDELGGVDFGLSEWLDDDIVALVGGGQQDGDILTCRLSTGRCELAVPGRPAVPGHLNERVVP